MVTDSQRCARDLLAMQDPAEAITECQSMMRDIKLLLEIMRDASRSGDIAGNPLDGMAYLQQELQLWTNILFYIRQYQKDAEDTAKKIILELYYAAKD